MNGCVRTRHHGAIRMKHYRCNCGEIAFGIYPFRSRFAPLNPSVNEARIEVAGPKFRVVRDFQEEREVGPNSLNPIFPQAALHSGYRFLSCRTPRNEFGYQWIVIDRDSP